MDGYHPNQIDPRPKRWKNKDNPYTIFTIGLNTNHSRYFLSFKDVNGTNHRMEIDSKLFEALDQFELDDISLAQKCKSCLKPQRELIWKSRFSLVLFTVCAEVKLSA